ncbi:UDP-glycosyltransferase 75C1-like [Rutidosis leptorrhynchoides]|uniref:UDP-glycosyltransferase 75C1-like n=1 Tax=Rutidosis leptorrhynchoides TaxID=125765 RepID=UPI003A99340D
MTRHQKILILAFPLHGFINPSICFANRLLELGADVTICTSISITNRLDKKTIPDALNVVPFSDGHDNGLQPPVTLQQLTIDFTTNCTSVVEKLISSASAAGKPFDNLVYTTGLPWAAAVAKAHGVKSTLLWCQPAIILVIYYYYFNGYKDLISSATINNDNYNMLSINLPGLPQLTKYDMPSFFLPTRPKEHDFLLQLTKDHLDVLEVSPRVLVNSFNELEMQFIQATDKLEFLPIGPLTPPHEKDSSDSCNCLQWLKTKHKSSVVYVSFGTIATLSMEQTDEIAKGLLEIGRPFLWVIRDSEQVKRLSKKDELQKQGMIVDWCAQVAVLSHQAIGCFMTHGGWNSTVETLYCGVPVVVFPVWTDQGTNAKMIEDVWKIGVRVKRRLGDGVVEGDEIKRCVELVMNEGEMKRNAEKWRGLAREALSNGGSSSINLQAFLDDT